MERLYDGKSHTVKDEAKEKLIAYIAGMDLERSTRLPSENVLCELFGVSRVTVRAVLDEMIAEGRVIRTHGSGSFVNPAFPKIKDCIYPFVLFEKLIREKGNEARADNLGAATIAATAKIAGELGIAEGAPVVRSRYAFYADEVFCLYCENHFDRAVLTERDIVRLNTETSVLYKMLLDSTGRIVTCDFVELTATDTTRTPELCAFVPEAQRPKPFLLMATTAYDQKNRPLIYSDYYYDTDYFRFGMVRNMRVDLNEYKHIVTRSRPGVKK
ncbi:GntR family transcriptional regulator [Ruminococcaceae bacterium OttesenSCG-928-A11]|nr:GntR family transcriptional regulator [Ruminococcaceae bacterium OttesenSCG-928-A11]